MDNIIAASVERTPIHTAIFQETVQKTGTLRPERFKDYIGQAKIVENLTIYIESAKRRKSCLDHILFYGPAGLGKTTLAKIVANELGAGFKVTSAPAIEKTGELASILCQLQDKDVLFVDEIHRLPKPVEEFLYSAMEDHVVDIVVGQGEQSRSIRLELPDFTLIGATTRAGMLSAPLRDRFGIVERLAYYSPGELSDIIRRSAHLLGVELTKEAALCLAGCSRGTPRVANNYLKRCRDFAMMDRGNIIDKGIVLSCMKNLGISKEGYNDLDQKIIDVLKGAGKPVGLSTISAMVGEDAETIENVVEPFLIYSGVLTKTAKGRVLTDRI